METQFTPITGGVKGMQEEKSQDCNEFDNRQ
jgi:hypothetical protein